MMNRRDLLRSQRFEDELYLLDSQSTYLTSEQFNYGFKPKKYPSATFCSSAARHPH
jgi:hypothetical protein